MNFVVLVLLTQLWQTTQSRLYTDCAWMADQMTLSPTKNNLKQHKNWNLLPHGNCGQRNLPFPVLKIFSGKKAKKYEFPWMAKMILGPGSGHFTCAGSIISERYIVTAAHCCETVIENPGKATWSIGGENYSRREQTVGTERVDIPEGYDSCVSEDVAKHDICLVRLSQTIQFNDYIKPICVPIEADTNPGDKLHIAGWGLPNPKATGAHPTVLQKRTVDVVSQSECRKVALSVDAREICTSFGQCTGDSGGPLMKALSEDGKETYWLYGVISFSEDNCAEGELAVSMRVTEYIDWILDYMQP